MERVADYVIQRLVDCGITHVFMITGRGVLYLTDAVAKNQKIRAVSTYHEQGASYAAMAYAAAKGGTGACLVSTGCAATNAVTAALCAFQDNLPVIFISGQNMLNETTRYTRMPIRTYGSQEADIVKVVESITKYAVMLEDPYRIAYEMDKAIIIANEGRKGPVWIDIPLDIQNARVEPEFLERYVEIERKGNLKKEDIIDTVETLNRAERPIFLVGGGLRASGAVIEFIRLVTKINIPVVFSATAADIYGTGMKNSVGAVGSIGGSRAGNIAIQNADFVLAIGTKLCSQSIGTMPEMFARNAKITVIDIDSNEHKKQGRHIDKLIIADARVFIKELLKEDIHRIDNEWMLKCLHWKKIFNIKNESFIKKEEAENKIDLYRVADTLSDYLSENATVITDAGLEELIIPSTMRFRDGQRCMFPASQGAMGYAIPAIIGAYYSGRKDIITVVGDGSIMMNLQELLIISKHNIPAKIFVINNDMYAVIRKRQHDLFRNRTIGNDPSNGVPAPDFKQIAKSFGFEYLKIESLDELASGIEKVLGSKKAFISEIICVQEQNYFHMSYAINEKRKLVKRPLEDLSPFLDRDLIKNEMIIPMIDE